MQGAGRVSACMSRSHLLNQFSLAYPGLAVPALVAAYGFEEGSGTTTLDASGNHLAGTLSNAAWAAAGRYGGALSFNGTSSWVTVADSALLHLTTGMTVEAWVRPAAASTD